MYEQAHDGHRRALDRFDRVAAPLADYIDALENAEIELQTRLDAAREDLKRKQEGGDRG